MGIISLSGRELSGQAPSREALESALHALDSGSVVAIPIDTGYALVADVSYTSAADRLFSLTHRTREYELSLLVADTEQALSVSVGVTHTAERLMEKAWPGALTLVLPRHPDFVADLGSDEETVGVRCPDHLVPRLLCEEAGPLGDSRCLHARHAVGDECATGSGCVRRSYLGHSRCRRTTGSRIDGCRRNRQRPETSA